MLTFSEPRRERLLTERIRNTARPHGKRYWQTAVTLAVLGTMALLLWPRRGPRLLRAEPKGPMPEYRVRKVRNMPSGRIDRVTVVAVTKSGFEDDSLRLALDWLLYETLDETNRRQRRRVRVVWAYLVEHETTPPARWRAMAIWHDPALPGSLRPAGPGGDVVRIGSVQYDFTNPVLTADRRQNAKEERE
jgi:hypothetical protein